MRCCCCSSCSVARYRVQIAESAVAMMRTGNCGVFTPRRRRRRGRLEMRRGIIYCTAELELLCFNLMVNFQATGMCVCVILRGHQESDMIRFCCSSDNGVVSFNFGLRVWIAVKRKSFNFSFNSRGEMIFRSDIYNKRDEYRSKIIFRRARETRVPYFPVNLFNEYTPLIVKLFHNFSGSYKSTAIYTSVCVYIQRDLVSGNYEFINRLFVRRTGTT